MAKRKRRKSTKKSASYSIELKGILFLLIAIVGCCPFGIAADIIKGFAAFLAGGWYIVPLIGVGAAGLYMIIKREDPDYLTSHLIGLYCLMLGILVLSHTEYINSFIGKGVEAGKIFNETINNIMDFVKHTGEIQGGGIIGAIFSVIGYKLLTLDGTKVVCAFLIVCGLIMFTGVSIYDAINTLKEKLKEIKENKNEVNVRKAVKEAEEEYEEEEHKKVIISSMDELASIEPREEKEEHEETEEKKTPSMNTKEYRKPPISLLNAPKVNKEAIKANQESIKENVKAIEKVTKDFGVDVKVVAANIGPSVTQYELEVKSGTRLSKITALNKEIALDLGAKDVRIQAPIPGKKTVGIELPNKTTTPVAVREILSAFKNKEDSKLLAALGKSIMGEPVCCEIDKTPHLLVAGSTGSGKSVCINSMITSLLMRTKPDEVKLVLVDPKKVELSMYNGVPHLLTPVVTDPKKANIVLQKIVKMMEDRYDLFENSKTKNIAGYNAYVDKKNENLPEDEKINKLPYIVVIIDELADLMLVAAKEVEDSIMRITQMARAAGIHLIVATQRPSTDVITGVVKANIPSRISFAVSSSIDSRTILDMSGAEKLLGKGDMLFLPQGENVPVRVQGTFISDDEIKAVVDYTISQQKAMYDNTFTLSEEDKGATTMVENDDDYEEPLYNEIREFVITQGKASASLLQRRFRLGYNRAARCIDLLEERGIVGPSNGSKPREVLVKLEKKEDD
ncbi:MAG: DNA translocase FtsK [Bacilli bacterium]|nr:DNA translocase FtsK [Bacilli bacterium]